LPPPVALDLIERSFGNHCSMNEDPSKHERLFAVNPDIEQLFAQPTYRMLV